MSVQCPYCGNSFSLKGAHAGRFKPNCPACHNKFALFIPDDPEQAPVVGRLAARPQGEKLPDHVLTALGLDPDPTPPPRQRVARMTPQESPVMATSVAGATSVSLDEPPAQPPIGTVPSGVDATSMPDEPRDPALSPRNVDLPAPDAKPVTSAPRAAIAAPLHGEEENLTGSLGGYELKQKLGQGGMGAVYLARQVSLDRNVAVKVLPTKLADNPMFVARFTREAYAAAQLTHHNVVQIHDIGEEKRIHFFSMEFVEGQTLSQLVRQAGRLDPEVAVGYILQAARGLKFAHDHGMIHRDIKPDNLLLNDQGIVKVADLGLVKTGAAEQLTPINGNGNGNASPTMTQPRAMGTPAYMAPEQAQNAAVVDQRADIYALGCTLYQLLTGRPPFTGRTANELITKHLSEPITPPEMIASHVGPTLSAILMKMVAKRVEDRYQTMAEVISALEGYLGVDHAGPFSPREEHVKVLEVSADRFNSVKWNGLRSKMIMAFYALCALAVIVCVLPIVGSPVMAGAMVGFALLTTASYLVVEGITQRTHLLMKARQYVFGASILDWLKGIAAFAVLIMVLVILGQHWWWLGFAILSIGVACGFHFSIDLLLNKERKVPIQHTEHLLKQMRMRGLDEDALRQFVCKYSGQDWEEFYEALFGYEAKLQARGRWSGGDKGKDRRKHAAWRDPVIRWLDHRSEARREAKQRRMLAKIEERSLAAAGKLDAKEAKRKAQESADELLQKAAKLRAKAEKHLTTPPTIDKTLTDSVVIIKTGSLLDHVDTEEDEEEEEGKVKRKHESYFKRRYGGVSGLLFGGQTRFLLAMILLVGFCLWRYQNREAILNEVRDMSGEREEVTETVLIDPSKPISAVNDLAMAEEKVQPLKIDYLPLPAIAFTVWGSWAAGVAGGILLIGGFFRGKLLGFVLLIAAAVVLGGMLVKGPIIGPFKPEHAAMLVGTALAMLGIFFFRDIQD